MATTDADRARRQKLMAAANVAYENCDEGKLRSIIAESESSPDAVEGEGVGAELIRVIRKIAQIQKRLTDIHAEIQQLNTSDLYQLRAKADEAEKHGRDLLKAMALDLERQVEIAKSRKTAVAGNKADR